MYHRHNLNLNSIYRILFYRYEKFIKQESLKSVNYCRQLNISLNIHKIPTVILVILILKPNHLSDFDEIEM